MKRAVQRAWALDLRFAAHAVVARPLGAALIVATLALLMGTALGFFTLYWGARHHAHDVADVERVVEVSLPAAMLQEIQPQLRSFVALGPCSSLTTNNPRELMGLRVALVGPGWMEAVRPTFLLGKGFSPADHVDKARVVIISHRLWQQRFAGAADVVGRKFAGPDDKLTIAGVFSQGFVHPVGGHNPTDVWIPTSLANLHRGEGWNQLAGAARLADGVTIEMAADELERLATHARVKHGKREAEAEVGLGPLAQAGFARENAVLWRTLLAALGLVLVGGANIGAHVLGRNLRRGREHVLHLVVGAWPGRLVRQGALAAAAFAALGAILALPVAAGWMAVVKRWYPAAATNPGFLHARFDGATWRCAALLLLAVFLLVALPSLLHFTRADIHTALKNAGRTHSGGRHLLRMRQGFLALQAALAIVLIVFSMTTARRIVREVSDKGFDASHVVYTRIGQGDVQENAVVAFNKRVLARLAALPGVDAAGLASPEPFAGGFQSPFAIDVLVEGLAPTSAPSTFPAFTMTVGGDLVATLRLPVVSGRWFPPGYDPSVRHEVVVDQTFVDHIFKGQDPLGRKLRLSGGGALYTIVGVLAPVKLRPASRSPEKGIVFLPFEEGNLNDQATWLVRTTRPAAVVADEMQAILRAEGPEHPIEAAGHYRELLVGAVLGSLGQAALTGVFGLIALLLTVMGLYGSTVALVVARTNELGTRLAIGAGRARILWMVVAQGLRPVAAGAALSVLVLAVGWMNDSLRPVLFDAPLTWSVVALAFTLIPLVAVTSLLGPAWRASRMSPHAALRAE